MRIIKITLFGKYFINNYNKMSIDDNLFFDLSKVSFISDEIISNNPLENGNREISFYFTFILDGVLFELRDNQVLNFNQYSDLKKMISSHYQNVNVFKLRRSMLQLIFP